MSLLDGWKAKVLQKCEILRGGWMDQHIHLLIDMLQSDYKSHQNDHVLGKKLKAQKLAED